MRVERAFLLFSYLFKVSLSADLLEFEAETTGMSKAIENEMKVVAVRKAEVNHPTGDPNFSVMQAFPAGFTAQESDPFLMCDAFGPTVSTGIIEDPDKFQVQWHPHRGMDILTYLVEGNRGDMLIHWEIAANTLHLGSGIEHAEGGGTPAGVNTHGFQIWVNVPSERKMDDPKYGTEPPENIPVVSIDTGSFTRVLAGEYEGRSGPFETVTAVQIVDTTLAPNTNLVQQVPAHLDNALLYVYKGKVTLSNEVEVGLHQCARMDAANPHQGRQFTITSGPEGASFMWFAGKMLKQPIAWHGPFVMTTDAEIKLAIREYQQGTFLKKRAAWDYKRIATKF